MNEIIQPAKSLTGALELPGDKSISHRYAMLAALAEGTSELRHFSDAADCHSTLNCIRALGADVKTGKGTVRITGRGAFMRQAAPTARDSVFLGNRRRSV